MGQKGKRGGGHHNRVESRVFPQDLLLGMGTESEEWPRQIVCYRAEGGFRGEEREVKV